MEEGAFGVCKLLSQLTKCRNNDLNLEITIQKLSVCIKVVFFTGSLPVSVCKLQFHFHKIRCQISLSIKFKTSGKNASPCHAYTPTFFCSHTHAHTNSPWDSHFLPPPSLKSLNVLEQNQVFFIKTRHTIRLLEWKKSSFYMDSNSATRTERVEEQSGWKLKSQYLMYLHL